MLIIGVGIVFEELWRIKSWSIDYIYIFFCGGKMLKMKWCEGRNGGSNS